VTIPSAPPVGKPDESVKPLHVSPRPSNPDLDALLGVEHRVFNYGHVRVVDVMGDDDAIVQAARVSYGAGTKTVREDAKLIHYLLANSHLTPFEMCEFKGHIKAPISVARHWVRHRSAHWNELSTRYSVRPDEYYVPSIFRSQDQKNRQGSGPPLGQALSDQLRQRWIEHCDSTFRFYNDMLGLGVAREQARGVLPLDTYTEWYWKVDLRSLLHFLDLRCDCHAQWEIRQYAGALAEIVRLWVPVTYAAWREVRGHV
jgi:thymidylate synthase (FAD)